MINIAIVQSPDHLLRGHPESPNRFKSIEDQLREHLSAHLRWLEPEPIQPEVIEKVHPGTYISFIEQRAAEGPGLVDYGDTYVTQTSFQDALNAVGATLATLEAVVEGEERKGFALIRPPGHHTSIQKAMGFCLFNNIAIATRRAQELGIDRVGIVDFDVHHGNGTQDIFYADADVLYISTHQWGIFPGTGARNEIGHEQGRGSTVNIPLPSGVGDNGFEEIYNKIVEPSLHRFDPEILLVSAGYDAHWNDPLASLQISSKGFFEITRKLVSYADDLCEGRMMMVLEGGYNPDALARSVRYSCHALVGEGLKETVEHKPSFTEPDIHPLLDDIRQIHSI